MDGLDEYTSVDNILRMSQQPYPMGPLPPMGAQPLGVQPLVDAAYPPGPYITNPPGQPVDPYGALRPQGNVPAPTAQATPAAPRPTKHLITAELLPLFRELVKHTESSGNYQAKNPSTSASGAYQYVNRTWNNYGGYPEARLAPKAVQDARFNEDAAKKLHRFKGDIFKMVADHMLPAQANHPELWAKPSVLKVHGKTVHIPPVADYVRKVVKGSPFESEFEHYLKARGGSQ